MTAHAEDVLDFRRVLTAVAGRAASPAGRAAVEALTPFADVEDARRELASVAATRGFLEARTNWSVPIPPELEGALERLKLVGGVLDGVQLFRVGRLLEASSDLATEMDARAALDPHLAAIRSQLFEDEPLAATILRTVDDAGEVLDTASKELRRIRQSLSGARNRVVRRLEAWAKTLPDRIVVSDASVSLREGRYVVPIRREGRGEVGGIVHDESGSGATIFVEPPVAVEWMNEVRELERDEAREVQRILRELSATLHELLDELRRALKGLVRFDSLVARARAAMEWRAETPALRDVGDRGFRIVQGRHPLLLMQGNTVVPFDLEMGPDERTLVVSGPNTGGKSVFLKALGLLTLMGRTGVIPPVGKGTELPDVVEVYADIGDQQSIAESLSTFSAHLSTLRLIIEKADSRSMVLIDEMGTGTDPAEGAALARAILETLTARGCLTIVTSHLGALKSLDAEGSGVVNASLEFDAARMEPTYRFVKGRPGRSYGLAIARRLGFPSDVLDLAHTHIDGSTASVEDLLERLEKREREAREMVGRLDMQAAQVERLEVRLKEQQKDLDRRERTAERRAKEDARNALLAAREEVEEAIRDVRSAARDGELDEAARRARRKVEEAADARRPDANEDEITASDVDVEIGTRVRVGRGSKGRIVAVDGSRATVEVGGLRIEVPIGELRVIEGGPPGKADSRKGAGRSASLSAPPEKEGGATGRDGSEAGLRERGWSGPMPAANYEIDLRGLRVDEVDLELGRALDGAIMNDMAEVRVIHGKGTGAVKARVLEALKLDPRVQEFRGGKPGEGGGGVTLVVFR